MNFSVPRLIDALGGTSAVAAMTKNPPSTVHSWRRIGLTDSRFDHLRLAAREAGLGEVFRQATGDAGHVASDTTTADATSSGNADKVSARSVA